MAYGDDQDTVDVYAGDTAITITPDDPAAVPALIDALRPFDWQHAVGDLPPPRFPDRTLATVAAARRIGTVRPLVRRGLSPRSARMLLRLARALEPLGRIEPARCG
jgi:hypothetical protein